MEEDISDTFSTDARLTEATTFTDDPTCSFFQCLVNFKSVKVTEHDLSPNRLKFEKCVEAMFSLVLAAEPLTEDALLESSDRDRATSSFLLPCCPV
jgi:hypothetical protein